MRGKLTNDTTLLTSRSEDYLEYLEPFFERVVTVEFLKCGVFLHPSREEDRRHLMSLFFLLRPCI